jgi:hypothetical protein
MHHERPVVVRRGGFFPALAYGFFATLITLLIIAGGVALYAVNVVDRKSSHLLEFGQGAVMALPDYIEALPPAIADLLNDRRAPGYRDHVEVQARVVAGDALHKRQRLLVDVTNKGDQMITLLAVRVVLANADDVPVRALSTYAATPVMIEDEWRGPLMPQATRRCALVVYHDSDAVLTPQVEITDLRVWKDSPAGKPALPAGVPAPPALPAATG